MHLCLVLRHSTGFLETNTKLQARLTVLAFGTIYGSMFASVSFTERTACRRHLQARYTPRPPLKYNMMTLTPPCLNPLLVGGMKPYNDLLRCVAYVPGVHVACRICHSDIRTHYLQLRTSVTTRWLTRLSILSMVAEGVSHV